MAGFKDLVFYRPDQVLFWTGAGVSADGPTSGPLGRTLTDRALGTFFLPGLAKELADVYSTVDAPNASARPRLETVLDIMASTYGLIALEDVLSDITSAPPNDVHRFFARHMTLGGEHVTANFDTCIERSMPGSPAVFHFHGDLNPSFGLRGLGARLSVIENGFPSNVATELDARLRNPNLEVVVFAGYSGSDFFDATPYLESRWHLLEGKHVVWQNHGHPHATRHGIECDAVQPHLMAARDAGAIVTFVQEPLRDSLNDLAHAWGLSQLPPPPPRAAAWSSTMAPSNEQRRTATLALMSLMGIRGRLIDLIESNGGPESSREADAYADALWGAGRYRAALKAWQEAIDTSSEEGQARITERQGAVLWIRGQYLRAERVMSRALDEWARPASTVSAQTQALLLEMYGRVLTHMRRSPDTRLAVTRRRVDRVRALTETARVQLGGSEGIHLRARIASVLADLDGNQDPRTARHVAEFSESESLHGWLNYRHHQVRQEAQIGHLPSRVELESLRDTQNALGAHGDAARVALLPGAPDVLPPLTGWSAFKGIDVTAWHRLRIASYFLIRWCAHRIRGGAHRAA